MISSWVINSILQQRLPRNIIRSQKNKNIKLTNRIKQTTKGLYLYVQHSYLCQSRPSTAVAKRTERASKRRADSMKIIEPTNGIAARNSAVQCL